MSTPASQVQGAIQTSELPTSSTSVSEAARLLAQRRSALRQQQAPTDQLESEGPDEQDIELEGESGALEEVDGPAEGDEEGALDSAAEASDLPEELGDDAVIEFEGEQIPLRDIKAWREGAMRSDDYQRKTQVVAQQQQVLASLEQDLSQFAHGVNRFFQAQATPHVKVLKRFEETDWSELASKDPQKFQAEQARFTAAKAKFEQLNREWQGFLSEYQALSQRALAARAQAALPEIRLRIKGWNDAMYAERSDFLVEKYRADRNIISKVTDPWFWEMANDAFNYRKGLEMPKGAKKIVPRSPTATPRAGAAQRVPQQKQAMAQAVKKVINARGSTTQTQAAVDLLRLRRQQNQPAASGRRRS